MFENLKIIQHLQTVVCLIFPFLLLYGVFIFKYTIPFVCLAAIARELSASRQEGLFHMLSKITLLVAMIGIWIIIKNEVFTSFFLLIIYFLYLVVKKTKDSYSFLNFFIVALVLFSIKIAYIEIYETWVQKDLVKLSTEAPIEIRQGNCHLNLIHNPEINLMEAHAHIDIYSNLIFK